MTHRPREHSVVAIYASHGGAESAVQAVHQAGLDMRRLSIAGKHLDSERYAVGFYTSDDRVEFWGGREGRWESLWRMLIGNALFAIPAIGSLVVMGPLVDWMVAALEDSAEGGAAGVLAAALASIGIPMDSVLRYEVEVKAGRFIVIVHGTPSLIERARTILWATGASQLMAHADRSSAREHWLLPARSESSMLEARRTELVTRDDIPEVAVQR